MKYFLIGWVWLSVIIVFLYADSSYVSGSVTGTWEAEHSPYMITGDIDIPIGCTLVISSGVEVVFTGHYAFRIYSDAILRAIGEEDDSILFTATDTILSSSSGGHGGLRFLHCDNSCSLYYCRVEYGNALTGTSDNRGGGVYCYYTSPFIINCTITKNNAEEGGGIYCNVSNPIIEGCGISNNQAESGGGLSLYQSGASISHCNIIDNRADEGGGIECYFSSPHIDHCIFRGNLAAMRKGGAISCQNSHPEIGFSLILYNTARFGGGIGSDDSHPNIFGNYIQFNTATYDGGGIYLNNSNPTLENNIIADNEAAYYGGGLCLTESSPVVINCTVSQNETGDIGGGLYAGKGSSPVLFNTIFWADNALSGNEIYLKRWTGNPCSLFVAYCNIDSFECQIEDDAGAIIWGEVILAGDPLFESSFHLGHRSPNVNTGAEKMESFRGDSFWAPSVDIDEEARPMVEFWDIGADESPYTAIGNSLLAPVSNALMAYPNPFNASLLIELSEPCNLGIYDLSGRCIYELKDLRILGEPRIRWEPHYELSSGLYLLKADYANRTETAKVIFMK
ncbi:right-handed parallel beta-helix repeat-containing protein [bacterium]|nr:right-handed parallel beta-helix repeat-containing protein [bacterium]